LVTVDDNTFDAGVPDPLQLPAGTHTLVVAKASYDSQTKKVTLKVGQKEKTTLYLTKQGAGPGPGPGPGPAPARSCGKFLERCP